MLLLDIVIERAYVVFRVTARNPRAVVAEPYGRAFLREMGAVRQEPVSLALSRDIRHGEIKLGHISLGKHRHRQLGVAQQCTSREGDCAAGHRETVSLSLAERPLYRLAVRYAGIFVRILLTGIGLCRLRGRYAGVLYFFLLLRRGIAAFADRCPRRRGGAVSLYVYAAASRRIVRPGGRSRKEPCARQTHRREYGCGNGYAVYPFHNRFIMLLLCCFRLFRKNLPGMLALGSYGLDDIHAVHRNCETLGLDVGTLHLALEHEAA